MKVLRSVLFIGVALAAPLFASSTSQSQQEPMQHMLHTGSSPAVLVKKVQQVTQSFVNAIPAQWKRFLGCVSGPEIGAMGVHFVNSAYVMDGEIDVNRPEALIYEFKNDAFRLVGVEYIVMAEAWHANPNHVDPPVLEGQAFQFVSSPNRYHLPAFYELHVWAWQDNPNGAFVDWNPNVSCEGR